MPTNKIALRSAEQFMTDYTPIYQPIYPIFLGGKSQQYAREVGELNFRRVTTVGDIRVKHITPKDTELKQVAAMEGQKTFKKYYMANQYVQSTFQSREGVEEVIAQVLDEHQKFADELLLTGEGTSNSNMINNGLYFSGDANYTTESSVEIASGDTRLSDFHTKVVTTAAKADNVAGRKVILFFGNVLPYVDSLYATSQIAWKKALADVLGSQYSLVKVPEASTPSGAHGWIVANVDQVKLHYTELPQLMDQGQNSEKMYVWSNFLMGSMMLEVLAANGVIRQNSTLAA